MNDSKKGIIVENFSEDKSSDNHHQDITESSKIMFAQARLLALKLTNHLENIRLCEGTAIKAETKKEPET